MPVNNFVKIDSDYGSFIVNRHCLFQAEALIKTGRTHIESELKNISVIVDTLESGSVILDGGANIGFFTIPVAQRTRSRGIKILSFEPQRTIFSALSGALALNDLDHVIARQQGLSDSVGTCRIPPVDYGQTQDFGTVQLQDGSSDGVLDPWAVSVTTIDDLDLPRLDFLKLDVEGFELRALAGGKDTIQKYRPWIWIEYMITGQDAIKQSLSYLDDYEFVKMDYQNMLCAPRERVERAGMTIQAAPED